MARKLKEHTCPRRFAGLTLLLVLFSLASALLAQKSSRGPLLETVPVLTPPYSQTVPFQSPSTSALQRPYQLFPWPPRHGHVQPLAISAVSGGTTSSTSSTFLPAATYDSGGAAVSIAVADVNRDGNLDLLVANTCGADCSNGGTIAVLLGNGDGSFQAAVTYGTGGQYATSVAVADVNGDGKPDMLVTNYCDSSGDCAVGSVSVLLGNGDGTFQPPVAYESGGYGARSVAVADLNGDSKPDLVIANYCTSSDCSDAAIAVLLGNGDGTFQEAITYRSNGEYAYSIAVADVNGDGKPDVLVANGCVNALCLNGSAGVLLGNGNGTFQPPVTYGTGSGTRSIAVADLNADGIPDLLAINQCASSSNCSNGSINVLLGNGDGTFQSASSTITPANGLGQLAIADFSGDGNLDVASGAGAFLLLGNGNGTFQNYLNLGAAGSGIAVGDFNNDGKADLAVGVGGVEILLNVSVNPSTTSLSSSINPAVFNQTVTFTANIKSQGSHVPTGTVTFSDNGSTLGTATVANGGGSLSVSTLSGGTHSITAAYSGDTNFGPSTSAVLTETISSASSTTNISSSLNPAVFGQSATFTATITPQFGGASTGTVTFFDGGNALGSVSVAGNTAAFSTVLNAGSHSLTAKYSGDSNVTASTSSALAETVNQATTTTGLASSANPSLVNQAVSFMATVSGQFGGALTGLVTFKQGSTTLGSVALSNGQASFTTTYTTSGTRSITATYSGDTNSTGSTSAALTQTVNKVSTKTAVVSSKNPANVGDSVTFTVTVTSTNTSLGLPSPSGSVTFKNGTAVLGSGTLSGGTTTITTSSLTAGTHSITAVYAGDSNYLSSTSSMLVQTVNGLPTTTTLSSSVNPSIFGQVVTFTASVKPSSGTGAPTGTVTFKSGTTALAKVTLASGAATYSTSTTTVGAHSITVVYSGDTTYAASSSAALSQVVNKASTTTALVSSQNPSSAGQSVTLTATVSPQFSGTPAGTVTFKLGTQVLATVTVSSGAASYTTTTLPAGSDNISATYSGGTNFAASSGGITQVVN